MNEYDKSTIFIVLLASRRYGEIADSCEFRVDTETPRQDGHRGCAFPSDLVGYWTESCGESFENRPVTFTYWSHYNSLICETLKRTAVQNTRPFPLCSKPGAAKVLPLAILTPFFFATRQHMPVALALTREMFILKEQLFVNVGAHGTSGIGLPYGDLGTSSIWSVVNFFPIADPLDAASSSLATESSLQNSELSIANVLQSRFAKQSRCTHSAPEVKGF